jgi:hypothetical protein
VLGVGVVGVCCKPKGMCGVVVILGVSCQLNAMTRTLLRVLKKKKTWARWSARRKNIREDIFQTPFSIYKFICKNMKDKI